KCTAKPPYSVTTPHQAGDRALNRSLMPNGPYATDVVRTISHRLINCILPLRLRHLQQSVNFISTSFRADESAESERLGWFGFACSGCSGVLRNVAGWP